MADLKTSLKSAWMKSMEAIGNTASNIASNTKYKVQEMNLINRRREILSDFGAQAYEMWQKGEQFPEKLARQLEELSHVDEELNAIRTERLAGVKTEDVPGDADAADADAPQQAEPVKEEADAVPEAEQTPALEVEEAPAKEETDAPVSDDDVPTLEMPNDHPQE